MRLALAAIVAATLSTAGIAGAAWAHHGWESYDAGKQQNVTGTIAELKWEQPHAVLWVNSGGKKLEVWLSPLQRMVDRGLTKDALTSGKTVTVDAQPHTQKVNEWKALGITVDGKSYNLMR
ncbi:MAG: DUF6152 family protein [Hyphomonadaceae bacterium]|nr:DUF6152 family protein [Hyphomonadaceae bacterium]